MQVVLYAQVLHKMLRFAQIPHFDIQVVSTGQKWRSWMFNEAGARDWVYDFRVCIWEWFKVLNLALHSSLHFCWLSQVINFYVPFRRCKQKLAGLSWMELTMCNDFIKFKNLLWSLFDELVVHVAAFSSLSISILLRTCRTFNVPHGDWGVIWGDERLAVRTLGHGIYVILVHICESIF